MAKINVPCCAYENRSLPIKINPVDKNVTESTSGILEIMKAAPYWSGVAIKDSQIVNISLNDYRGTYLVFLFYPYDFTIVCPTELLQFSDRVEEFESLDCKVVAVSTDSEFTHLAWSSIPRKQGGLGDMRLPMLSDKSHEISKLYGVYDSSKGISYRGLFIIDDKSILRHVTINDIAISRSVDEVLRVIETSRFVDKHGDICPIGPKPDERESNTFSVKSKEYFETDLIKKSIC